MAITKHDHSSDRFWSQTRLVFRGPSNRWTRGEQELYLDLAIQIGDVTHGVRNGVRRLVDLGAFPISTFEFGDLVQAKILILS